MILKKHILINRIKYKNDSILEMAFNENFQPYFIFKLREENTFSYDNSIRQPVFLPFEKTIKIIQENAFNNNCSLGTFSLVHGTGGEIIDIVKYNSQEYKNLIKLNKIKPSSIEQGSFVKLQDGRDVIFVGQYKSLDKSYFLNLLRYIVDDNSFSTTNTYFREQRIELYEDIHKKSMLLNVFIDLNGNLFFHRSSELKNSIVEVFSVVPEFNVNNFSLKRKIKEVGLLSLSDFCFDLTNLQHTGRHHSFPKETSVFYSPFLVETEPGLLIRISNLFNQIRNEALAIENQEGN